MKVKIKIIQGYRANASLIGQEELREIVVRFLNSPEVWDVICVQYRITGYFETWPDVVVTYKGE